uniref:STAS domain-containing protein n=1 Tax=Paractinoplanes polyasparticus TaxID=2856853 RepID=UPI001C860459|nr:STAS domain-containing protein [Actinoplanes polyasparticus]
MTAPRRFVVDEELTIVTAADHRERLLASLGDGNALRIDLSGVGDVDTAGLQVLVMARAEGFRLGLPVEFAEPSAAVTEALALTRLEL